MTSWDDIQPAIAERLDRTLTGDPQWLFAGRGRPPVDADVVLARLIGFDEEVVRDVRLSSVLDEYREPIRPSYGAYPLRSANVLPHIGVAIYEPVCAWSKCHISAVVCDPPEGVTTLNSHSVFTVALIRYVRKR